MTKSSEQEMQLIEAARQGNLELVKSFSSVCMSNLALDEAAAHGHLEVMDFLLPLCDPKDNESFVLRWAASSGQDKAVEKLLAHTDPLANDSEALRWGATSGNLRVVQLLAPHSNVLAEDCDALTSAVFEGSTEIIDYLLPFHNLDHLHLVYDRLKGQNSLGIIHLAAVIKSWEEHQQLDDALQDNSQEGSIPSRPSRKL